LLKPQKKTNVLTELIERRNRWLQVVGPQSSDEESEENMDSQSGTGEFVWDFGTVKEKTPKQPVPDVESSVPKDIPKESAKPVAAPQPKENLGSSPSQPAISNGQQSQAVASQPAPGANNNARPSALTSVIYPVLSKLLKQNQEEGVIAALAQLKIAFDNAERAKPGITHSLIAQIIETLKR